MHIAAVIAGVKSRRVSAGLKVFLLFRDPSLGIDWLRRLHIGSLFPWRHPVSVSLKEL